MRCIYLELWRNYESNVVATRLWHRSNGLFVDIVVSHSKQTTLGALGQTNMAPGTNAHPMPADGRFPVGPSRLSFTAVNSSFFGFIVLASTGDLQVQSTLSTTGRLAVHHNTEFSTRNRAPSQLYPNICGLPEQHRRTRRAGFDPCRMSLLHHSAEQPPADNTTIR